MIQSRRDFLASARNGLVLSIMGESITSFAAGFDQDLAFSPSDFLSILPNGSVRVFVGQGEMGKIFFWISNASLRRAQHPIRRD